MRPTSPPVYCARGDVGHTAAYLVQAPGRSEVVCQAHLAASKRWAGPKAKVTPLQGHEPPPEQAALF